MRITFLALATLFLLGCNNSRQSGETASRPDSSPVAGNEEEPASPQASRFPQLFTYLSTQDPDFTPGDFEGGSLVQQDTLAPQPLDTASLAPFRPYLVYSADSTKAIDLVSYNYVYSPKKGLEAGGPDSEVALLDLQKGTRKRLLFLGPSTTVLEAKWGEDGSVWIAGAEEMGDGGIRPLMWHFATTGNEYFVYKTTVQADIETYAERLLQRSRP